MYVCVCNEFLQNRHDYRIRVLSGFNRRCSVKRSKGTKEKKIEDKCGETKKDYSFMTSGIR